MSGGAPTAADFFDPNQGATAPVAGVRRADAMPLAFQYFVAFWHAHCSGGKVPPLAVLDKTDAPPISSSGIVFDAEPAADGDLEFRIRRAGEMFDFYYRRRVDGCCLADLYPPDEAARQRKLYRRILRGTEADFLERRRSSVPGREIVRIERIYAPFANDREEPAHIVGLCNLSYA